MAPRLPLLLEPLEFTGALGASGIAVVDLSRREIHGRFHLPGAAFLDYGAIVAARPPVNGLLPDDAVLAQALAQAGIAPDLHVVAYDDEGGGKAARLLWTLEVLGHPGGYSLLDGGLHAWAQEGLPLTAEPTQGQALPYPITGHRDAPVADRGFILAHLHDPEVALLDARSPEEYAGQKRFAEKAGHIPGAVNMEWTRAMDPQRQLRMRGADELRSELSALGIAPHQTVVTYCQSHHRSAFTWFMLHRLGYRAKGYAGSWSDWGNAAGTPVE